MNYFISKLTFTNSFILILYTQNMAQFHKVIFSFIILFTSSQNSFAQDLDVFADQNEVIKFKLPANLFSKIGEYSYQSQKLNANILFKFYDDYLGDDKFDADLETIFKKVKSSIRVTYTHKGNNSFTLSGYDQANNIVWIRGNTEAMRVRNNPDNDDLTWLWTKTCVVKFTYPSKSKLEMDKVINTFIKNYELNLYLY